MPCIRTHNGWVCGVDNPVYEWGGWLFEIHSYCGPWPLNKLDRSTPRKTIPAEFWQIWEQWKKVPNKEDYRVA